LAAFCDGRVLFMSDALSEVFFVQLMTVGDIRSDAGRRYEGGTNLLQDKLFNAKELE
jgi:hypothetical protein